MYSIVGGWDWPLKGKRQEHWEDLRLGYLMLPEHGGRKL